MVRTRGLKTFSMGLALVVAAAARVVADDPSPKPPDASSVREAGQETLAKGERFWRQIAESEPRPTVGSRALLGYVLTLGEVRQHPERLERLFALTTRMQDRDPKSPFWGNLRWYWRDTAVSDTNAVEFCMQDATTIWLRHGDWIPAAAHAALADLLRLGLEGCLRHRVQIDYTNIAILNAGNLIVLGECLGRRDAVEEGRRRLDAFCEWTAAYGVHEFCSPTYYGTDCRGRPFLFANARGQRERDQAAALLQWFWTDISLNWFAPSERLGGCHSRSYDYPRGLGMLDWFLWLQGWFQSKQPGAAERVEPYGGQWSPPPALWQRSARQFPRLVAQRFGILPAETRTHMMYRDVTLSTCGAAYGSQDATLVVEVPGSRQQPRCYFIPDGRDDPYGQKRYETGAAKHMKALHLIPFWAASQRTCDALALALYRDKDLAGKEVTRVKSHFVFRRAVDGVWLGGRKLTLPDDRADTPLAAPVEIPVAGESLVLRYGTAAVGIRLVWSRDGRGRTARAALVVDRNTAGCMRLTVDHGDKGDKSNLPAKMDATAGVALWVRVGSGLAGDAEFDAWRKRFEAAGPVAVQVSATQMHIEVVGQDGPVGVTVEPPLELGGRVRLMPEPCRGALELDGHEIGRPLLTAVEPLRSYPSGGSPLDPICVPAARGVYWEAEAGLVAPGMAVWPDAAASGGRYVAQPDGSYPLANGSVSWPLQVEKPGRYWLWVRVRAADEHHNSVYLSLLDDRGWLGAGGIAKVQPCDAWQWQRFHLEKSRDASPLELPGGVVRLHFRTRQTGMAIDRLFLTPNADQRPGP